MALKNDDGSLYDEQEATGTRPFNDEYMKMARLSGSDFAIGQVHAIYSELASVTGSGAANDTVDFCKLPDQTWIVGGWLYTEDALHADNSNCDLGVVYEGGESGTTNDGNCLCDAIDTNDGADTGSVDALPAGSYHMIGQDVETFPFKVDGGVGTVRLLANTTALLASKDIKLVLYVIFPA
jgi:hypothetical protein